MPSAAPGTCSATPASAPTRTCSPSATRSARGRMRRRSPTARRSSTTSGKPHARTASTATSASGIGSSAASWSSADAAGASPRCRRRHSSSFTCNFLFACSGYYRYDHGYLPGIAGIDHFEDRIVHPQHWPTDLDYAGKRVVVIGSGATAVTLVPSMAKTAAHVTMLQRSPSYVVLAAHEPGRRLLRRCCPAGRATPVRWFHVGLAGLLSAAPAAARVVKN